MHRGAFWLIVPIALLVLIACQGENRQDAIEQFCVQGDTQCIAELIAHPETYCNADDSVCHGLATDARHEFLQDPGKFCSDLEQPCKNALATAIRANIPTPPPPDPRLQEILLADPVIQALIGDGQLGEDYWVGTSPWGFRPNGQVGGWVTIVFAEPASYEGEIVVGSNPCKGHSGSEESADLDDPCRSVAREFSTTRRAITKTLVVRASVDVLQRLVYDIQQYDESPDAIKRLIESFSSTPE